MSLEHQHAGQATHPVDVREPGWSRSGHRAGHEARGQYTKQASNPDNAYCRNQPKLSVSHKCLNLSATHRGLRHWNFCRSAVFIQIR